jgi:hypothetical protein
MRSRPQAGVHVDLGQLADDAPAQIVGVHRDEPLRGRAEDHRVLAAPAVRIGVLVRFGGDQQSGRAQIVDDLLLRGEDRQPGIRTRVGREAPGAVDRAEDRQAVFTPVSKSSVP